MDAADPELTPPGDVLATARSAFGWSGEVSVTPGARGALGRIWRVSAGPRRFALKEIFFEPPSPALLAAELAFTERARRAGVRAPAGHPGRSGEYLVTTPEGRWLRLYDWVDLAPAPPGPATAAALGELLARLHRSAPPATDEPDGGPPHDWYERVPTDAAWATLDASGAAWADVLAERLATVPALTAAVAPSDPDRRVLCHRDLHPENVLADPAGALVVVDWDNLGPAEPGRELARVLFDWYCPGARLDLAGMDAMHRAYLRAGGPGRITEPADFTLVVAVRLNFLRLQAGIATDPAGPDRDRAWAEREVAETLEIMPTPGQLAEVLALTRAAYADRT
jgi:Ser/Thr protein kinase RdoA (MazF antagonist)